MRLILTVGNIWKRSFDPTRHEDAYLKLVSKRGSVFVFDKYSRLFVKLTSIRLDSQDINIKKLFTVDGYRLLSVHEIAKLFLEGKLNE